MPKSETLTAFKATDFPAWMTSTIILACLVPLIPEMLHDVGNVTARSQLEMGACCALKNLPTGLTTRGIPKKVTNMLCWISALKVRLEKRQTSQIKNVRSWELGKDIQHTEQKQSNGTRKLGKKNSGKTRSLEHFTVDKSLYLIKNNLHK